MDSNTDWFDRWNARLWELCQRHMAGTLTPAERAELDRMLGRLDTEARVAERQRGGVTPAELECDKFLKREQQ
jgi:hypothetical protein